MSFVHQVHLKLHPLRLKVDRFFYFTMLISLEIFTVFELKFEYFY